MLAQGDVANERRAERAILFVGTDVPLSKVVMGFSFLGTVAYLFDGELSLFWEPRRVPFNVRVKQWYT